MTTTLSPAPVSIRQLTYYPKTKRFVGEISSTHGLGRVFDDACDEGLTIIGATGREIVMVVTDEIWHGSGSDRELAGWRLIPVLSADAELVDDLTLYND